MKRKKNTKYSISKGDPCLPQMTIYKPDWCISSWHLPKLLAGFSVVTVGNQPHKLWIPCSPQTGFCQSVDWYDPEEPASLYLLNYRAMAPPYNNCKHPLLCGAWKCSYLPQSLKTGPNLQGDGEHNATHICQQ